MQIETLNPKRTIPDAVHAVEFYPSLDDYIHISTKLTDSVASAPITTYAYYAFLFMNTIVFPAYLWLNGYFVGGLAVFVINLAAILLLLPRVNTDALRRYYANLFGDRENEVARVELSSEGLYYYSNRSHSFWAWERIKSVEETKDAIFFFSDGNGLAIRKSGFAYEDEQKQFSDFAKLQMRPISVSQLPE